MAIKFPFSYSYRTLLLAACTCGFIFFVCIKFFSDYGETWFEFIWQEEKPLEIFFLGEKIGKTNTKIKLDKKAREIYSRYLKENGVFAQGGSFGFGPHCYKNFWFFVYIDLQRSGRQVLFPLVFKENRVNEVFIVSKDMSPICSEGWFPPSKTYTYKIMRLPENIDLSPLHEEYKFIKEYKDKTNEEEKKWANLKFKIYFLGFISIVLFFVFWKRKKIIEG